MLGEFVRHIVQHMLLALPHMGLAAVELLLQGVSLLQQAFQQKGVKGAALVVGDHPYRLLMGESGLVDALAGQGVVYVGHGHGLGGDGNVLPFRPSG